MVIGFSGLLFFLLIGFVLTRIYLRFLRIAYIDDSFLYISKIDSTETTIPLDKIKSVEYSSFPASTKTERFILIKYYDEKMTLKKVLINPAHLDIGITDLHGIKIFWDSLKKKLKITWRLIILWQIGCRMHGGAK